MTWEPGTVAALTLGGESVRGFVAWSPQAGVNVWHIAGHSHFRSIAVDNGALIDDVRPLVTLDLPDGALAGWPVLIDAFKRARHLTGYHMIFDGLMDQIEAQTRPPKPAEPTGLFAVVVDRDGTRWVNWRDPADATAHDRPWIPRYHPSGDNQSREYADIDVAEVLSEGIA